MNSPLVSIVVPNYNHYSYLQQRLESIFNQTYQNFEVILLDDCSTDASVQLLKSYENHPKVSSFIVNTTNSGSPFKQWQKGFELAKGDYIWIAESDDYCDIDFIEKLLDFNSSIILELDIIYCQSFDVDFKGNLLSDRVDYTSNFKPNIWNDNFTIDGTSFVKNYLKVKCVIPNASAVLFKRKLLRNKALTEDRVAMKICGDWLFWLKISEGSSIGFIKKHLNYFRDHQNVTRNQTTYEKIYIRCFEEKLIRDYLTLKYNLKQERESLILYNKWFKLHKFSKLFSSQFYAIKMKETSFKYYIIAFLKHHRTKVKILKIIKL